MGNTKKPAIEPISKKNTPIVTGMAVNLWLDCDYDEEFDNCQTGDI
jgi:hypothetical protein